MSEPIIDITAAARAYADDPRDLIPFRSFTDLRPRWVSAILEYEMPASITADGRHIAWPPGPRDWTLRMARHPASLQLLGFRVEWESQKLGTLLLGLTLDGRAISDLPKGFVPLDGAAGLDRVALLGGVVQPALFAIDALNAGRAVVKTFGSTQRLVMSRTRR